ncbi:MAG: hypothetical protein OXT09_05900, partial [Myxococcales bacterium]|nr:hypothetical protein [Myxococcales bacterium]
AQPPPAAAPAPAPAGPTLVLPPEETAEAETPADSPDVLSRGLKDQRTATESTGIGGYAELHYNLKNVGEDDEYAEIDMHRLVLFVTHNFSPELRFYSEFEVEHALVGDGKPGEVGIEQAYVDYLLAGDALGVRAGIVLVPMGIINQWHEPPIFHGVERPNVDKVIIPSTWREGGVGIFGEPSEGLRYELYVTGGLDAGSFRARDGIRAGRQKVAEASASGPAVTGRLEYEPTLGLIAGVAGYYGQAGPNAELFDTDGGELELDVPVLGVSGDVRGRYQGLEARGTVVFFSIGETDELRGAADADGNDLAIDVGSQLYGAYGELAYDLLFTSATEQQLLPFVRVERYDTMAKIEGRDETAVDEAFGITELVFGLSYRPHPSVVFKGDYILKTPDGDADTVGQLDLGVGAMF